MAGHGVRRAARGFYVERGVVLEHGPGDQMVEQHADGGHVLLEGGGRQAVGLRRFQILRWIGAQIDLRALRAA